MSTFEEYAMSAGLLRADGANPDPSKTQTALFAWEAAHRSVATSQTTRAGGEAVKLAYYNAGLLGDYGGGNVEWWWDYLRSELERAHDFYQSQVDAQPPSAAPADNLIPLGMFSDGEVQWESGSPPEEGTFLFAQAWTAAELAEARTKAKAIMASIDFDPPAPSGDVVVPDGDVQAAAKEVLRVRETYLGLGAWISSNRLEIAVDALLDAIATAPPADATLAEDDWPVRD